MSPQNTLDNGNTEEALDNPLAVARYSRMCFHLSPYLYLYLFLYRKLYLVPVPVILTAPSRYHRRLQLLLRAVIAVSGTSVQNRFLAQQVGFISIC